MHIYLDTSSLEEIKQYTPTSLISGVTTNPTLVNKALRGSKTSFATALKRITAELRKHTSHFTVSAEVTAERADAMVTQGITYAKIDPAIVVKVPMTPEGLKAVVALRRKKIRTNVTLVFSLPQAVLAAKAGAYLVSPFMGRLDDQGMDSFQLLEDIREVYDRYNFDTYILAASIRHLDHVRHAMLSGADIATMPPKIFDQMYNHVLTDKGLATFAQDWKAYTEK